MFFHLIENQFAHEATKTLADALAQNSTITKLNIGSKLESF